MLDAGGGVAAGRGFLRANVQIDSGQFGGFARQRGQGRGRARKDQAAQIGLPAHAVKSHRRAEVHHQQGGRIRAEPAGGESPHQAVRSHFGGPFVTVFQGNGQVVGRAVQGPVQIAGHGLAQQRVETRHHGRGHAGLELRHIRVRVPQKGKKREAQAVRGVPGVGWQGVGSQHVPLVGQPHLDGRVAYVEEQKFRLHGTPPRRREKSVSEH